MTKLCLESKIMNDKGAESERTFSKCMKKKESFSTCTPNSKLFNLKL